MAPSTLEIDDDEAAASSSEGCSMSSALSDSSGASSGGGGGRSGMEGEGEGEETFGCPLSSVCEWRGRRSDLLEHCQEEHKTPVLMTKSSGSFELDTLLDLRENTRRAGVVIAVPDTKYQFLWLLDCARRKSTGISEVTVVIRQLSPAGDQVPVHFCCIPRKDMISMSTKPDGGEDGVKTMNVTIRKILTGSGVLSSGRKESSSSSGDKNNNSGNNSQSGTDGENTPKDEEKEKDGEKSRSTTKSLAETPEVIDSDNSNNNSNNIDKKQEIDTTKTTPNNNDGGGDAMAAVTPLFSDVDANSEDLPKTPKDDIIGGSSSGVSVNSSGGEKSCESTPSSSPKLAMSVPLSKSKLTTSLRVSAAAGASSSSSRNLSAALSSPIDSCRLFPERRFSGKTCPVDLRFKNCVKEYGGLTIKWPVERIFFHRAGSQFPDTSRILRYKGKFQLPPEATMPRRKYIPLSSTNSLFFVSSSPFPSMEPADVDALIIVPKAPGGGNDTGFSSSSISGSLIIKDRAAAEDNGSRMTMILSTSSSTPSTPITPSECPSLVASPRSKPTTTTTTTSTTNAATTTLPFSSETIVVDGFFSSNNFNNSSNNEFNNRDDDSIGNCTPSPKTSSVAAAFSSCFARGNSFDSGISNNSVGNPPSPPSHPSLSSLPDIAEPTTATTVTATLVSSSSASFSNQQQQQNGDDEQTGTFVKHRPAALINPSTVDASDLSFGSEEANGNSNNNNESNLLQHNPPTLDVAAERIASMNLDELDHEICGVCKGSRPKASSVGDKIKKKNGSLKEGNLLLTAAAAAAASRLFAAAAATTSDRAFSHDYSNHHHLFRSRSCISFTTCECDDSVVSAGGAATAVSTPVGDAPSTSTPPTRRAFTPGDAPTVAIPNGGFGLSTAAPGSASPPSSPSSSRSPPLAERLPRWSSFSFGRISPTRMRPLSSSNTPRVMRDWSPTRHSSGPSSEVNSPVASRAAGKVLIGSGGSNNNNGGGGVGVPHHEMSVSVSNHILSSSSSSSSSSNIAFTGSLRMEDAPGSASKDVQASPVRRNSRIGSNESKLSCGDIQEDDHLLQDHHHNHNPHHHHLLHHHHHQHVHLPLGDEINGSSDQHHLHEIPSSSSSSSAHIDNTTSSSSSAAAANHRVQQLRYAGSESSESCLGSPISTECAFSPAGNSDGTALW